MALYFFCKDLRINKPEYLHLEGPLLIASNHPNSFLDAIILDVLFRHPLYALARGDAFASPLINSIFTSLHMLPIHRIAEGRKNVEKNHETFDRVQQLLEEKKIVLIFSESYCHNDWTLTKIRKGTSRIALNARQNGIPVNVLPAGINYSSFRHLGKAIHINFGSLIKTGDIPESLQHTDFATFNEKLQKELEGAVYIIPDGSKAKRKEIFEPDEHRLKKTILFIPAIAGYLFNGLPYYIIHLSIRKKAGQFYDSIMVGALILIYPVYTLLLVWMAYSLWGGVAMMAALGCIPLSALALLHYRGVTG